MHLLDVLSERDVVWLLRAGQGSERRADVVGLDEDDRDVAVRVLCSHTASRVIPARRRDAS